VLLGGWCGAVRRCAVVVGVDLSVGQIGVDPPMDRTSVVSRYPATPKDAADLGRAARWYFGGVLLSEPVTWGYADNVGGSKSRSCPGSVMSSWARISA
jgi:hypothetical protein